MELYGIEYVIQWNKTYFTLQGYAGIPLGHCQEVERDYFSGLFLGTLTQNSGKFSHRGLW